MWIDPGPEVYAEWRIDPEIRALVSTRQEGVSQGPFQSLNLSFNVGDESQAVLSNRSRVAQWFECAPADMIWAEQVHGGRVKRVTRTDASTGEAISGVDGLLTDEHHLILSLVFADCVPIFLASPEHGWVGVVHAGWRGTAAKIVESAVLEWVSLGISPRSIWAGIGPSIGPCCYEVDEPVIAPLRQALGSGDGPGWTANPRAGHYQLDLWQVNRQLLVQAGVWDQHIETSGLCTSCQPQWFFSHRRDQGRTGRIGSFICRR
ncbi:MAG: peptidoglycan editing factor PgeF [Firmicutes bacterium]|nr:peptidoglycan editing factor PgeF [Bacillota bacterium]